MMDSIYIYIYIYMNESFQCLLETITALLIGYACMLSCFGHIQLFVTLWTVAHQTLLSMGFSR